MGLEAHAGRTDVLLAFGLNDPAGTANSWACVWTPTLNGLALLDAGLGLVDTMEATFFAAAEAGHYHC